MNLAQLIKSLLRDAEVKRAYAYYPSITEHLAVRDYDADSGLFLLQDNRSLGMGFRVKPIATESSPEEVLNVLCEKINTVIKTAIPQEKVNPWVMQVYVEDNPDINTLLQGLRSTLANSAQCEHQNKLDNPYTPFMRQHVAILQNHLRYLRQHPLFYDEAVTDKPFTLHTRQVRVFLYRKMGNEKGKRKSVSSQLRAQWVENSLRVKHRVYRQLQSLNLKPEAITGAELLHWLQTWFNPGLSDAEMSISIGDGNVDSDDANKVNPKLDTKPLGWDIASLAFRTQPESCAQGWLFNQQPHQYVSIQGFTQSPVVGHLSHARGMGEKTYSLLDQLPVGSRFCLSVVITHQQTMQQHLEKIAKTALGGGQLVKLAQQQLGFALNQMAAGECLFPLAMGVYLRGQDKKTLLQHETTLESVLHQHGLQMVLHAHDPYPSDSYLRQLPFNYDYQLDTRYLYRNRLCLSQDIAKLLPFYGRSTGIETGTNTNSNKHCPGFLFFNRGGEPFTFDPYQDKSKNSHMLILGDTGTGKSNLCQYLLAQMLLLYRPRLFICEAGGSFDLFAEYLSALGFSVNHVKLDPKHPISLNPFADALNALAQVDALDAALNKHTATATDNTDIDAGMNSDVDSNVDNDGVDMEIERDLLGEMVLSCQLMITGGEPKETEAMMRRDRAIIAESILIAARLVRQRCCDKHHHTKQSKHKNKPYPYQVIASDIVEAMNQLAETLDPIRDSEKIHRARKMADNLQLLCQDPVSRQFFNTPGKPWPLVDVTVVDFGLFAKEGYEAQRAIAYAGINHKMLALAEASQYQARPIISVKDENHVFLKVPLLAAIQTREAKMARKLGIWLWLLTQNLDDFADESRKILSMLETFICLATSPEEIDKLALFKPLSIEEKALLNSARKVKGQYTEGVILHPKLNALFRHIPPREYLMLAATDKEEKVKRRQLMQQHQCSEVEAAFIMAKEMRKTSMGDP
jgi:conjugative transfer ATPase